jgi:hypothetical protein
MELGPASNGFGSDTQNRYPSFAEDPKRWL